MQRDTHRAIVRHAGASAVSARPRPSLAVGDMLLAPEAVSLCGTDHQMLRSIRDDPSPILGHEGACRIVAMGGDIEGFHVGQRVTINPTNPHDPTFLLGHNIEGLFQQRVVIPHRAIEAGLVVPIDEALSSPAATLIEPTAIVDYALDCLRLSEFDTLVIVGDGLIGNLAARRASDSGKWNKVLVEHRTEAGYDWTTRTWKGSAVHSAMQGELEKHLNGESVGVLIATHRDRTSASIDRMCSVVGGRLRAVHVTAGVPPHDIVRALPGVDIGGIRAANTGGPWPPRRMIAEFGSGTIAVTGNRGVTSPRLARAAADLASAPDLAEALITHVLDMDSAAQFMNRMIALKGRHIDDQIVMRLVVMINPEFTQH